jgi:hypothetical protein
MFAEKVFPFRVAVPQPRQGRKIVAQGGSPGEGALTPPSAPLSRAGGRGDGGEGGFAYPRLTPWATLFRPDKSGLALSTNIRLRTLV